MGAQTEVGAVEIGEIWNLNIIQEVESIQQRFCFTDITGVGRITPRLLNWENEWMFLLNMETEAAE